MRRMLASHPGRAVVWLDADARMKAKPTLLLDLVHKACDVAFYFIPDVFKRLDSRPWGAHRGPEALAGGTMFFQNTNPTRKLVERWCIISKARPKRWEQQNLQAALGDMLDNPNESIQVVTLPQSYCRVFDRAPYAGEPDEIVVLHTQASRRLKRMVGR